MVVLHVFEGSMIFLSFAGTRARIHPPLSLPEIPL